MNKDKIFVFKEKNGKIEIEEWEKDSSPIMKCGHQAQSIWRAPEKLDNKNFWSCVICDGRDSKVIKENQDIFEGRYCCSYGCGSYADWNKEKGLWIVHLSSKGGWNCTLDGNREVIDLPFLDTNDNKFYCGCMGWD